MSQQNPDLLMKRIDEMQAEINTLTEENESLKHLAEQGKAYLEIVRTEAKEAHIVKSISEGMSEHEARHGEEHFEYCTLIDKTDDLKSLYRAAQVDYRAAKTNKELGIKPAPPQGTNRHFSRGSNDIR